MYFGIRTFLASLCITCLMLYCLIAGLDIYWDTFPVKTCACMHCINEDPWFTERYSSQVPKFMNRRNSNLSTLTLDWWLKLQPYNKVKFRDVVDPLFSLFPDKEHYNDAGPDRCRTCAVVGNSDNLIGSHYGLLIDAHDFIFRMNQGPTVGYERDVGLKTTHRALYPESAMDLDSFTHLVLLPFKVLDMEWVISIFTNKNITRTYKNVKHTIQANKDKVMIMSPEFMRYVYESWLRKQGKYPSTGFLILMLALHICDQVNVFGFGARSDGRWYHYYDKQYRQNMVSKVHKGSVEYNFMLELEKRNKIKIYKGW
ncbi:CMP-N-acetylneuraminate-beta-galactosamide-alpha-2,3-sialyltransferase 1 [Pangasianodon hypophthalmus]|uniref:CMP-N-acetylneuraminate-beta-galactosamide- alpha-2,3-sialyltransferase 1 n=1 Tax=Pangasianodon hypophthalmus TaxID=310915 RepID=UPI002307BEB8|nr:CMP-N-acetylneuraminate-beta-galactosamide-alpha-2,3-sialyltransferase 1 [Pangasianodon hypophthalmus]